MLVGEKRRLVESIAREQVCSVYVLLQGRKIDFLCS